MKHLKQIYEEELYDEDDEDYVNIEIGDYVLCEEFFKHPSPDEKEVENFVNNNIGQFIGLDDENNYYILYENIPKNINKLYFTNDDIQNCRRMFIEEIKKVFKTEEEIENFKIKQNANKYNL